MCVYRAARAAHVSLKRGEHVHATQNSVVYVCVKFIISYPGTIFTSDLIFRSCQGVWRSFAESGR